MASYYLDIETYGTGERPDPATDRIISILFCAIDPATGRRLQEPVLLREWESGEREIVRALYARIAGKRSFDFVPVGFSILFDLWFLKEKFRKYCDVDLGDEFYLERPYIDLKQAMVLAHKGVFKGVRIGPEGNPVQDWYAYQDYGSIERHAMDKLERFLGEYAALSKALQDARRPRRSKP